MDFSSITNSSAFLLNGAAYTIKLTLITTAAVSRSGRFSRSLVFRRSPCFASPRGST